MVLTFHIDCNLRFIAINIYKYVIIKANEHDKIINLPLLPPSIIIGDNLKCNFPLERSNLKFKHVLTHPRVKIDNCRHYS